MLNNTKCTVFDVKKYAIHDGPGIRTTVFFKGCPLSCLWCHNPEGINSSPQVVYNRKKCIGCMGCVEICPNKALSVKPDGIYADNDDYNPCDECSFFTCADICPANARERVGESYSVNSILNIIEKDIPFYETSGGGVTFSGGEPLIQWRSLVEILKGCKNLEIHTAVDTTGFGAWTVVKQVAEFADLFLFDLKLMDDEKHKFYTGVSNKIILENLKMLAILIAQRGKNISARGAEKPDKIKKGIIVRIPLIPGINDDVANIDATGHFIANLVDETEISSGEASGSSSAIQEVNLLPYHDFQQSKYCKFGIDYKLQKILPPTQEQISKVERLLETFGLTVSIG